MPENKTSEVLDRNSRASLEKAFMLFQTQSELLEKSHARLKVQFEDIREKLSGTLESITDAVFIVVPSTETVEEANTSASELINGLGGNIGSLLDITEIRRLINAGLKVDNQQISFRNEGENVYWLVSVTPMKGNSEISREVVSIKDITEEKNLEIRLQREDRMASLGKVAASVAHEIRNPLGAIEGFAVLLKRDLKEMPASIPLAEKIVYAARQLNSVVGNLLSFTREFVPSLSKCDIHAAINDTLTYIYPMAEDHGVEIITELDKNLNAVTVDCVLIKQVFSNIITNAVEACPRKAGGKVEIMTEKLPNIVRITISDNGTGINTDRKKKIFEPFYTMKEGGIGLGLALCQRIVDAHHGNIEELGTPGEGAKFVIELLTQPEVVQRD